MREIILWTIFFGALVAVFIVSKDGIYRYPCQDPARWAAPECNPPMCSALKSCTSDLVGGQDSAQN
jgi:hypothetical protein